MNGHEENKPDASFVAHDPKPADEAAKEGTIDKVEISNVVLPDTKDVEPDDLQPDQQELKNNTHRKKPRSKKAVAAFLISLLLLIALAAAIVFVMINKKDDGKNVRAEAPTAMPDTFEPVDGLESLETAEPFESTEPYSEVETDPEESETEETDSIRYRTGYWYHRNNYLEELHIKEISEEKVCFDLRLFEKKFTGIVADFDGEVATFSYTIPDDEVVDFDSYSMYANTHSITGSLQWEGETITFWTLLRGSNWELETEILFDETNESSVLFSGAVCDWAQAYADALGKIGNEDYMFREVAFIFVDNDSTPELISADFSARAPTIVTMKDNKAEVLALDFYFSGGISYLENEGLIQIYSGHMGSYSDYIFSISNGTIEEIAMGNIVETEYGDTMNSSYTWNLEEVTKAEYYELLYSSFDFQNSKHVSGLGKMSFDDAFRLLEELGAVIPEETEDTLEEETQTVSEEIPLAVKVTVGDLLVREGPGMDYPVLGHILDKGTYFIVSVSEGEGSSAGWGKLKDQDGWISLDYAETTDVDDLDPSETD